MSCVTIDEQAGGHMVARYLLDRGHGRLGFLGILPPPERRPGFPAADLRLRGFREGLADAGVKLPDRYVRLASEPGAMRAAAHALMDLEPRPSAIFAIYDEVAAEVLLAAQERGLRVPDDVAVVGFDDRDFARCLGLTTVRQHLAESGRVAFELLRDRVVGARSGIRQTVVLPLEIVTRRTA